MNYDVTCNMDFHNFPVDEQRCDLKFESFSYTADVMNLRWDESRSVVNPNISLDQFDFSADFASAYSTDYYEKNFPGVLLRLTFTRKMTYHLVQTYLPSVIFVTLAWLSLLIDPAAIPGRVSMVMMAMLTLMHMFAAVRQNTPKVSYVSFLDVWMVMCLAAIFSVLVEFSVVCALLTFDKKGVAVGVERLAFVLIPALFAASNVAYWIALLSVE